MSPDKADIEETIYEQDDLLVRPGTYFNPQTEVVVVVDDSTSIDQEVFNMEAYEGAEWVRIADDVPIDENERDRLLEDFQTHYHPGTSSSVSASALDMDDGDGEDGETGQEPGRESEAEVAGGPLAEDDEEDDDDKDEPDAAEPEDDADTENED